MLTLVQNDLEEFLELAAAGIANQEFYLFHILVPCHIAVARDDVINEVITPFTRLESNGIRLHSVHLFSNIVSEFLFSESLFRDISEGTEHLCHLLLEFLLTLAFYREREVVLGSEIPGIADVASDALRCQSLADSRDKQPVLLFQGGRSDGVAYHTLVRDDELQFGTGAYGIFQFVQGDTFLIGKRIFAQRSRLPLGYRTEGSLDALLHVLGIYITYHHETGILRQIPLVIIVEQLVARDGFYILLCAQRHAQNVSSVANLQVVKVIARAVAAQFFLDDATLLLYELRFERNPVEDVAYGKKGAVHHLCSEVGNRQ